MAGSQRKKSSKAGRNKTSCEAYARRKQREKNKVKRLAKRVARHPSDLVAARALEASRVAVGYVAPQ